MSDKNYKKTRKKKHSSQKLQIEIYFCVLLIIISIFFVKNSVQIVENLPAILLIAAGLIGLIISYFRRH